MAFSDRYISSAISILFCISFLYNTSFQESSENFKFYNSTKTDFTIQYPENWSVLENFNLNQTNSSKSVEFITPFDPSDLIQEIFIVNSIALPGGTTLDQFVSKALNQFNRTYADFSLISLNSTKLGSNYNVTHIAYSYRAGMDKLDIKLVMTHDIVAFKDRVYVLTFGTPPNSYYDFLQIIQQMLSSFRIKQ